MPYRPPPCYICGAANPANTITPAAFGKPMPICNACFREEARAIRRQEFEAIKPGLAEILMRVPGNPAKRSGGKWRRR